jgi:predicted DNA-binding transcriptional regulator AlpA
VIRLVDAVERPDMITEIPVDAVPSLLGELEVVRARLWMRMLMNRVEPSTPNVRSHDRLLDPQEAANLIGVSIRWLYRHRRQLPFARPMSRKTLRFSSLGLQAWIAERHGRQRPDSLR